MTIDVTTSNGPIRGEAGNGVAVFRGIRFAAPPVGPLRFRAPVRPEPWSDRADCTRFGPIAPQPAAPLSGRTGEGVEQSEDCLFLNVFTPACDSERRPVLLWLHGGGFTIGSGSSDGYNGTRFAINHDVVIVTINYRLGALGFTQLGELGEEYASSGNAGMLDQVLALEWVRDNIAAFGGNPGNVTIFGESAGGGSVACLMAMPVAQGLFHKGIAESGSHSLVRQLDGAEELTSRLCKEIGGGPSDLLNAPVEQLLAAQQASAQRTLEGGRSFGPLVDGQVLPPPLERIAAGSAASVPLIIGSNRDEANLFTLLDPSQPELDRAGLMGRMNPLFGERNTRALEVYLARWPGASDSALWSAMMTDRGFRVPIANLAEEQSKYAPVFVYIFAWPTPVMGGRLGACHGLEIPFVFNSVDHESVLVPPMTPAMEELSLSMQTAWAAFARTGDPNHDGMPEWPKYETPGRPTMVFDEENSLEMNPYGEELALWD
jgi:para-nitrobenzyl esterase